MSASEFIRVNYIGAGNFGKVWLVNYTANSKNYVLKEVKVRGLTEKEIDQAVTEVKVLSQMVHFNVIRYKQAFIKEDALNIVMEYADGGDLHSKIQLQAAEEVYFEEKQVLNWYLQITFGLKYIHKQNILHRDLKTQNLFLTKDNIVKIGDFGIAKVLLTDSGKAETAIGTPYYLSPEICQSQPYNKKSDIWALGCILYEMATLRHAFDSPSFNNLVVKILHGEYGPLPRHYPYNPISFLTELMLQHEPEDRPSADQLLRAPSLLPYIVDYEQVAVKLIQARQNRKLSLPSNGYGGRKSSLSESQSINSDLKPASKRRSHSLDSGKRAKSDLRKAVILRQALNRRASNINGSTYLIPSPLVSPIPVEVSINRFQTTNSPEGEVSNEGDDNVFGDPRKLKSSEDDSLDVYRDALLLANKGDMAKAVPKICERIERELGAELCDQLIVTVNSHMSQSADLSNASTTANILKNSLPDNISEEMTMMAMLQWYLDDSQRRQTAREDSAPGTGEVVSICSER